MIQIDMKMPECCDDCPMLDEYGDFPVCRITQETRGYNFNTRKKRMDKCPMKPVEAVPLDKLCEWLERYATMDCYGCREAFGSCEDTEPSVCNSRERWEAMLTKWMEVLENG